MKYKILAQMVQHTADANPEKRWMTTYLGVVGENTSSQTDSRPILLAIAPQYRMMCATIDNFIHDRYAEAILKDIEEIEKGDKETWEEETETYMFWMTREGVAFEFRYGANGPEKGGEVTLAQFKLAVRVYLQFLRDPERKPIEVPFPEWRQLRG